MQTRSLRRSLEHDERDGPALGDGHLIGNDNLICGACQRDWIAEIHDDVLWIVSHVIGFTIRLEHDAREGETDDDRRGRRD